MNFQETKQIFRPWFLERGFQAINARLFVKDETFYLILAELQPCHGVAFFLNMGITFLWNNRDFSYEYTQGELRIDGYPRYKSVFGATWFDSPTFDDEVAYIQTKADALIISYHEMKALSVLENKLSCVPNHEKAYIEPILATVQLLSRDSLESVKSLKTAYEVGYHSAKLIYPFCEDRGAFRDNILELTNKGRASMVEKYKKLKLPPLKFDPNGSDAEFALIEDNGKDP